MQTKSILSILLTLCLIFAIFTIPASAKEAITTENIEIIIYNEDISEKTKEKIIAFYSNPESHDDSATTYGLTCTLFGHNLETSTIRTVTHKASTTAPRCLERTYDYSSCTRCDYEYSDLITSRYIFCCA